MRLGDSAVICHKLTAQDLPLITFPFLGPNLSNLGPRTLLECVEQIERGDGICLLGTFGDDVCVLDVDAYLEGPVLE